MQYTAILLFTLALFSSSVLAEWKAVSKTLTCRMAEWQDTMSYDTAVAIECRNTGKRPARILRADVVLVDFECPQDVCGCVDAETCEYQFAPESEYESARMSSIFFWTNPVFLSQFVTISPGQTLEIGFTFDGSYENWESLRALDIGGVQLRKPTDTENDALKEEWVVRAKNASAEAEKAREVEAR